MRLSPFLKGAYPVVIGSSVRLTDRATSRQDRAQQVPGLVH